MKHRNHGRIWRLFHPRRAALAPTEHAGATEDYRDVLRSMKTMSYSDDLADPYQQLVELHADLAAIEAQMRDGIDAAIARFLDACEVQAIETTATLIADERYTWGNRFARRDLATLQAERPEPVRRTPWTRADWHEEVVARLHAAVNEPTGSWPVVRRELVSA